jgi:MYXO-CTERM domain-containing protein
VLLASCASLALLGFTSPESDPQRNVGAPEIKISESGNPTRWHAPSVDITLDPSLDKLGPGAKDAVRFAFGTWIETDARTPALAFDSATKEHGKAKRDGVNRVIAAPITLPGHENDLAITISYVDSSGAILEADVIINTRQKFDIDAVGSCEGYDLRSIATHEAGHFFGLGEDREDDQAAMFYKTSKCETNKRILTLSDVAGIESLYDQAFESEDPTAAGCSMAATRPHPGSLGWMALCGLGLFVARRRRPYAA